MIIIKIFLIGVVLYLMGTILDNLDFGIGRFITLIGEICVILPVFLILVITICITV